MRGKIAQEDLLGDFGLKEIFADYIVGELHCDALDDDAAEDIATSSRQSLKYDDPRFRSIREFVGRELRYIAGRWTDLRNRQGSKIFCKELPAVAEWLNGLKGDTKGKAERWIGRLNVIRSDDHVKRELLKGSILAFESYRWKEQLDFLDSLADENLETVLQIFKDVSDLERSYYGQIVKGRLQVIDTLEEKLDADDKERVIQEHIYNNLWLLDPSWDIVEGSQRSERTITKYLQTASDALAGEERRARIDIGYRTTAGAHVVIELKRASVATSVYKLVEQAKKYRDGVIKLIPTTGYGDWPVQIVCLVGAAPPEWRTDPDYVRKLLAAVDARLVFYNEMLGNSRRAYAAYLEEHRKVDRLWKIFEGIDDFTAVE